MEASPSESGGYGASQPQAPPPAPMPSANAPPPFLVKTYEMVDDPSTNNIVSWSSTNNSFVVWDPPEFGRNLLPKYFKHNNFSSFVRQLNTYGFRKVDPDRWEFANEGFLRGQKHLLKTISRRKPAHGHVQQPQQVHGQSTSVGACVEVGKFGLEEEVERLKRDKNVLMQELVRLRQQQQATDSQMQTMVQKMQGMEQRQQQMMSFLAKAVNSPGFLAQFVQQQNDSNRRITEGSKKRRLKPDDHLSDDQAIANDGQIIKYQPLINEAAKTMLKQLMKFELSPRLDNHVSGVTLHEVPPCSLPSASASAVPAAQSSSNATADIQSHLFGSNSEIGGGSQSMPPVDYRSPPNMMMPQLCPLPDITPEGNDILHTEPNNGAFLDPTSLDMNGGQLHLDGGDFDTDTQIDWDTTLLDDMEDDLPGSVDPFWEKFLESPSLSVESEELNSSNLEDLSRGMETKTQINRWGDNASQHLEQLTEQMGNLSSEPENV